ncbi:MAG: hypothetical protein WBN40_03505 [Pseudomonadales bacterium]
MPVTPSTTAKSRHAIDTLLRHPQLWRASNTLRNYASTTSGTNTAGNVLDTGYRQLNDTLHTGGWPLGNLVECLSPLTRTAQGMRKPVPGALTRHSMNIGQGPLQLFLPALHQRTNQQTLTQGPVVLVAPPHIPYLPGWHLHGGHQGEHGNTGLPPLWAVTPADETQLLWAAEQILQSNSTAAVFIWLQNTRHLRAVQLRKLQLAARRCEALVVLFRDAEVLQQSSPAPLRLVARPVASAQGTQLEVHIAKQPGGWGGQQTRIAWHSRLQRPVIPAVRWPVHQPAQHAPPGGASSERGLPLLGTRAAKWS